MRQQSAPPAAVRDLGDVPALGPAPVTERECRKARKHAIPFNCKLGAGHGGDCSPYTNPGLLRGGGGPNLSDFGHAALAKGDAR